MSEYEILKNKADLCTQNSRRAETEWARSFWNITASQLKRKAAALKLIDCCSNNPEVKKILKK